MLLLCGSFPPGYVAPAGVRLTPTASARATTRSATGSAVSRLMKYPPRGFFQLANVPSVPSSSLRTSFTARNFGSISAACAAIRPSSPPG